MREVDELENEYQEKKALATGTTDEATVTTTYFPSGSNNLGQQAILRLETTAGESHLVGIDFYDPEAREDLITVYEHAGLSLENDPTDLVNKSIEISYKHIERSYRDDKIMVLLHYGQQKIETDWDFDIDDYRMNEMLTETKNSFVRAYRYVNSDDLAMSQTINNISADNNHVYVDFVESDDQLEMSKETTYDEDPQSAYERLIEYVGGGSVGTIADSQVYVSHLSTVHFGDHNDDMTSRKKKKKVRKKWQEVVTIEDTSTGVWIVSGVEPPNKGNTVKYGILATLGFILIILAIIYESAILAILGFSICAGAGFAIEYPGLSS